MTKSTRTHSVKMDIKMVERMARLYKALLQNAPKGDGIDMRSIIHDEAALALVQFLIDSAPKEAHREEIFLNGIVFGVFLSELGHANYVTRERSGEVTPSKPEEKVEAATIEMPDLSGLYPIKQKYDV